MANKKISDLPGASPSAESDIYPIVQGLQTRSQTLAQLRTAIVSLWQSFIGTFLSASTPAAARAAIGAIGSTDNITGSAAKLTNPRTIAASGDATWSTSFDGSANVTAALTLAASGVPAGTFGSVTVDAKGRVTAGSIATPVANGGTGATTATAAGINLGTATVGTNTDQLARSSMIQAEIANKRTWTAYTPTVVASSGAFTAATATGKYMVAFGICHFQAVVTVTTKGTGSYPIFSLPFAALTGSAGMPIPSREAGGQNGKVGAAIITAGLATAQCIDYANLDPITASGAVIVVNGSYPIA